MPSPPPRRPPPLTSPPPAANVPGSSPPPPDDPFSPLPPLHAPSAASPSSPLPLYPPWPPQSTSGKSSSPSTAVGVGVAIGAVVLLGLADLLIFCLVSKRSPRRRKLLPADFYNPGEGTTPLQPSEVLSATPLSTPKIDPYGMPNCIQKLKTLGLTPIEQYKVIKHLKDLINRQTFMEVEADVLDEIIKVVVQAQV